MLAASLTTASVPPADTCSAAGSLPYTLTNKTRLSPDSWLLRFALPRRYLGDDPSLPTCLKVLHPEGTDEAGRPKRLEKSYSPVSHPATEGSVDLVVKAYEPRPGGGVGTWLCGLEEGAVMHAALKAKRVMHGDAAVVGRWQHVGLVGGGTGIAPLLQIARILLEDTGSAPAASVRLLSVNRREEDILARQELEALAAAHPDRFRVSYSLTAPPAGWEGLTGRGSAELITAALPPPRGDGSTMVLVCGTDGFVELWGGPVARAPKQPGEKKGAKVQGPLLGLLAEAGFDASEVFKY